MILNKKTKTTYLSYILLIAGLFLVSCGKIKSFNKTMNSQTEQNQTLAATTQTIVSPPLPSLSASGSDNVSFLDFDLQVINFQNIKQQKRIVLLEDSSTLSSDLSPDGKLIARRTFYGLYVYDVASGEQVAALQTGGIVGTSTFNAEGSRIAMVYMSPSSPNDVIIRTDASTPPKVKYMVSVWDITDQHIVFSKGLEELCGQVFSPDLFQYLEDGSLVIASPDFDTHLQSVCRVSGEDGTPLNRLDLDPELGYARSLALSSDGQILSVVFTSEPNSYANPNLVTLSFSDGKVLFEKELTKITKLAFIPHDHSLVFNGGYLEEQLTLEWITSEGKLLQSYSLPSSSVSPQPLTVNEHYFAVSYLNLDEVKVFDLNNGTEVLNIPLVYRKASLSGLDNDFDGYIEGRFASDTGSLLIYQDCLANCNGENAFLRVINLSAPGRDQFQWEGPSDVTVGDLSPDGKQVAQGGAWNGDVKIWSTNNGQLLRVLSCNTEVVNQAAYSPDSSKLATVSNDGTTCLWSTQDGMLLKKLLGHQDSVQRAAFSPDGKKLLTSSKDNTMLLWDVESGNKIRQFENPLPEGVIDGMWFISDHTVLLTIPNLGKECNGCHGPSFLLDIDSASLTEQPWEWLTTFASSNGDWLLHYGVYPNYQISIGGMESGRFIPEKEIVLTSFNDSEKIALSLDGQWIYSLNANGFHIFDRDSGEQVDLAANHLCSSCYHTGHLEIPPDERFILDFARGAIIMWGIPN